MSKITKKTIKELRERLEDSVEVLQREIATANGRIDTLKSVISTLRGLEALK